MEMDAMYEQLGIERKVLEFGKEIEGLLSERFAAIDETAEYNQLKVIKAMQDNRVSDIHFAATTGYGYNDLGRDTLEDVYASVFHTESALVRPNLISGTHALHVALSGNLRPGDELLSPVGKPYDTLEEVIGIRESAGSLKEYGVIYRQADLLPDGSFDFDGIAAAVNEKTKLVTIQRSKGYATRPTLSVERIGQLIAFIKERKPDVICMVDNCYGEFVERLEPADVGADMMVGSLIKNPGGGLAPIGGYIAGRKDCIDRASYRLTAPGLGREVGASLGGSEQHGVAPRYHSGGDLRKAGGGYRVLPGNSGGRAGGQFCHSGAVGDAGLRRAGYHGRRSLRTGRIHRAFRRRTDQTSVRRLFPGRAYLVPCEAWNSHVHAEIKGRGTDHLIEPNGKKSVYTTAFL